MSLVYLSPFLVKDLGLTHAQIGVLASALAPAWAASSLAFGALSDRVGRRPVLIPAVFLVSALSWLSGIVHTFGQLFVARTLMGMAEGPTWTTLTATIEQSSTPARRGRNIGIVVSAAALVGLAVAPVLTTQIAAHFGWRNAFFVAGIPGLVLGLVIWKFVREPETGETGSTLHRKPSLHDYLSLLRYRNILLCCIAAAGFMTWRFVMNVFAPLYITEIAKHSATFAGFVIGASGLGSFLWGWIYPSISDCLGRKPTLMFVALLSALVPLTYRATFLIDRPWLMAAAGFIANGGQGMAALALVLVPTESVPPRFAATAIGLTTLIGEIFGGVLAPTMAGAIADKSGPGAPLSIASGGALLVFLAAIFLHETAPSNIGKTDLARKS
jgi:predicted MFS family arabinose efflux permease